MKRDGRFEVRADEKRQVDPVYWIAVVKPNEPRELV